MTYQDAAKEVESSGRGCAMLSLGNRRYIQNVSGETMVETDSDDGELLTAEYVAIFPELVEESAGWRVYA